MHVAHSPTVVYNNTVLNMQKVLTECSDGDCGLS